MRTIFLCALPTKADPDAIAACCVAGERNARNEKIKGPTVPKVPVRRSWPSEMADPADRAVSNSFGSGAVTTAMAAERHKSAWTHLSPTPTTTAPEEASHRSTLQRSSACWTPVRPTCWRSTRRPSRPPRESSGSRQTADRYAGRTRPKLAKTGSFRKASNRQTGLGDGNR